MLSRAIYKVAIRKPVLKTTKNGKKFYQFMVALGKNRGLIWGKCWDTKYDLTKVTYLENVVYELTAWKDKNGKFIPEIVIKSFGLLPADKTKLDKDMVKVNEYFKTPEEFDPALQEEVNKQMLEEAIKEIK